MATKSNQAKPKPSEVPTKTKTLVEQVEAAVKAAPWITPADGATVALAKRLAQEIEVDIDPKLGSLLVNVLGSLGLTVAGRGAKPQEPPREVNPLDAIRERAAVGQRDPAPRNPKPRPTK